MRTTLDLPEDLVQEAMQVTRFKSKTDTVIYALRELVRRRNIEELKALAGRIDVEVDLDKSRRRPGRGR
jgi:Arc/MetJ family transcription regulator